MNKTFKANGYIAELRQNKKGDFVVTLGYKDETRFCGMTVTDMKYYKTEKAALKKIRASFMVWLGIDGMERIEKMLKTA